jgi:4-hydroxy-L-threonine phosphate dehydrogenase PdxA
MSDDRPIIAVTMGDPAGIGPEIAARALLDPAVFRSARCALYGDARVMGRALAAIGVVARIRRLARPGEATGEGIEIVDLANADPEAFRAGEASALCGRASW